MKPETNKCTNGLISAPMVCSGPVHQCWCTAGGKVEEKKAGGNKALQPIASSVFYILRGSWPVMLNMALLTDAAYL